MLFRVRSMRFEGVGEDEAELLERELGALASAELRADLFSSDFRSQLRAADRLSAELARDGGWPGLAANLDLLFRWVVLRLVEGNSQVAARVLDLSLALLQGVQLHGDGGDGFSDSAQLSDAEALSLLPAVVERSGHPQDRIRAQHRAVLRAALPVYAVPKLLEVLTPGLSSKSARTRAETAEFVAATLLQERGSAALTALIACRARPLVAVTIGGEEVLRQFGRLEPREQDMVEERLRRSRAPGARVGQGRGMAAATATTTTMAASPAPRAPPMETPSRDAAWGQPALSSVPTFTPPAPLHATPPAAVCYDEPHGAEEYATAGQRAAGNMYAEGPSVVGYGAATAAASVPPLATSYAPDVPKQPVIEDPTFERRWEAQMEALASPDAAAVVEAMKAVCGELMPAAEGAAAPRTVALMARSAETLFTRVHAALVSIFAEAAAAPSSRLPYPARGCKYGLNVMLQGLAVREVACGLSQRTLRACVSLLLLRLLDDHGLLRFEEGHTLVKAVNVLMLKMLETTDRTYCFGALLQLLRVPPADPVLAAHGCDNILGQAPSSSSVTSSSTTSSPALIAKFHDLVVKCLIKLTKGLQADVASVDVGALLLDIHDFFLFLGVDEIRRRSGVEDKPLRMVKTILHELCKLLDYGIYSHAEKIPGRAAQPQPIIFAYISLNLSTLSASGVIQPPAETTGGGRSVHPSTGSTSSTTSSASSSQHLADTSASGALAREEDRAAVKAGLKEIMPRLMHRSEADAAMKQLYELRSAYPVAVDKYIAGTSDMFRAYIRDGLAALEAAGKDEGDQVAAPSVASDEGSEPLALAPEPAPARPVAPPRRAVPPSPNSLEAGALTPGGTLLTPSSASVVRLSSLRERLANARYSLEGNAAPPKPLVSPARSRATGDLNSVRSAIDDLAERMAALRRASHTSG
ncbi:hypothetical protein QBZ16_005264 [Prototheca wickerhamii]|uniref:TOG domain-containing protein n=1 Tax=Prototheca wickerhamii TaxID=3111 RepID=A0AAD9IG83_PROWI|nr:hypothetical protein QBZ16_005264 [Prototheca wickerhamii]